MPRSAGEIRPSAVTAAASVITSPAPPTARLPRCTRCQSLAKPSTLEYSHIGETAMRLRSGTPRSSSGEKRWGTLDLSRETGNGNRQKATGNRQQQRQRQRQRQRQQQGENDYADFADHADLPRAESTIINPLSIASVFPGGMD